MNITEQMIRRIDNEYEDYFLSLKCISRIALIGRAEEVAEKKRIWVYLKEQALKLEEWEQELIWLADENTIDSVYRLVEDYGKTTEEAVREYIRSISVIHQEGVSGEENLP